MNLEICKKCKRFPPVLSFFGENLILCCIYMNDDSTINPDPNLSPDAGLEPQPDDEYNIIISQEGAIKEEERIKHLYKKKLYPDSWEDLSGLRVSDIKEKDIINSIEIGKDCPYYAEHQLHDWNKK